MSQVVTDAQKLVESAYNFKASIEVFKLLREKGAVLLVSSLKHRFDVVQELGLKYTAQELKELAKPLTLDELLLVREQAAECDGIDLLALCESDEQRALFADKIGDGVEGAESFWMKKK